MGFFVRKPLESWGMEKWNEQTKHAQESCRQAGTRPQVSHVSVPVPQLLPFLLILLLQWTLFLTQSFIVHFCYCHKWQSISRSSPAALQGGEDQTGGTPATLESSPVALGAAGPCHQECSVVIAFFCNLDKERSWSPGTETGINTQRRADVFQRNRWKHTSLKSHRRINESTQT